MIRRNKQIERKVDEATLALRQSSEALGRERALLRSLIDSIPDLIFAKDVRGVYITSNKAFAKLLGRTADDVVGKTDLDIFPADLAVFFRERDADMVKAGTIVTNEEEVTYPDGRVAQLETSKIPFIADDGEHYGLIGVSRDITERKKIERALAAERERLQRILDASPVGVTITTDNIARFTNPRIEEMFALRVGSAVPDLYVHPEQRIALLDELDRKGIVRDFSVQFRGFNGEIRDCLSTLMHMEYEGRQGVLGWIVDVTELTKIQTALSEAKVAAEDATKAKAEFLANMSHEIRTPMNAVIGLAHLCLKTDLTAKQRDYVGKIHNAGTSLLSIINDILDFSKIEAGKLDIENVAFEVDSLMNNISTMVAQKIQDKGLELLFDISSDIPPALLGDPLRLGQVLINLLGNAVKFTETGEIRLIGELLERTGDKVKLALLRQGYRHRHDQGAGEPTVSGFLPSRYLDVAQIWRNRTGPGHLQATGGTDGRLDLGCQRAGRRQHVQLHRLVRPVRSDRAQGRAHAAWIAQGACRGRQCRCPGGAGGAIKNHWSRNRTSGVGC